MILAIQVHQRYEVQGRSDLQSLIEELITFAKTQPEDAIISTTYEGTALYIRVTDSFSAVYAHYIAARTQHLRPARFARR